MRMAVCPTRSLPPNAIAWLAALPPGKTKPHPQGTLPWSAPVQVFGRRHHERRLLLRRPASKKRQGTKSREVWAPCGRPALWGFDCRLLRVGGRRVGADQCPGRRNVVGAVGVGEEPVVVDAVEALGQHVHEKAA